MTTTLAVVDAFASEPFAGNPAAVCIVDRTADENWMRLVAAELSMPATAFLQHVGDCYRLRWFTRTTELELCGHGTLAAAHVLWERGLSFDGSITFRTRSGELMALRRDGWIELDFPAKLDEAAEPPAGLLELSAWYPPTSAAINSITSSRSTTRRPSES